MALGPRPTADRAGLLWEPRRRRRRWVVAVPVPPGGDCGQPRATTGAPRPGARPAQRAGAGTKRRAGAWASGGLLSLGEWAGVGVATATPTRPWTWRPGSGSGRAQRTRCKRWAAGATTSGVEAEAELTSAEEAAAAVARHRVMSAQTTTGGASRRRRTPTATGPTRTILVPSTSPPSCPGRRRARWQRRRTCWHHRSIRLSVAGAGVGTGNRRPSLTTLTPASKPTATVNGAPRAWTAAVDPRVAPWAPRGGGWGLVRGPPPTTLPSSKLTCRGSLAASGASGEWDGE